MIRIYSSGFEGEGIVHKGNSIGWTI